MSPKMKITKTKKNEKLCYIFEILVKYYIFLIFHFWRQNLKEKFRFFRIFDPKNVK